MDYDTDGFWKRDIFTPLLTTVNQNNSLQHNLVIKFILSLHNQINHLTESYCTDVNKDTYKNKIVDLS